ncbi:protein of unknown function [Taphrina deformans PYCC 5710]|uniref:BZIP domain-containing protein n=1 Tax=Taphrina deformans (strain PYCC 5710 / ATCC 11124 / CBS 356.35 / IMI 108563 / JCM 9778 / NBRC 8474) TaxID=1097556 RepID=R4XC70_TAPDE|nr:protein of unknown function [Taphrina deformans PYCC 5710]|eukprot:CCG81976.1 protein of unknown function [Taphrina deformans PYCC 5710]
MSANSEEKDERLLTDSPEPGRRQYEDDSDEDDDKNKGSKSKKLASGKRADQNRKAQRAFRQRKDKYIKDLELRSQELDIANSLIVQLKEENDRLNEIAKSFHSRVGELEAQLAHINSSQSTQSRTNSKQFAAPDTGNDEQAYYSIRGGPSRIQNEQPYGPKGYVGSVYSQSQGLM